MGAESLMAGVPEGARCARHAEALAAGVCTRCGDFVCGSCLQDRNQGAFCPACAPRPLYRSSPGDRIAAHLIDSAVSVVGPIVLAVAAALPSDEPSIPLMVGSLSFVALMVVQCVLIHRSGQSIGKRVMGLRIATLDGANAGLARVVFLRNGVPLVIGQLPLIGLVFGIANLVMLFLEGHRCLHDHIAGTIVVDSEARIAKMFGSLAE